MARVDSAAGSRLRFAVVWPEDGDRWQAGDKGRTVELDADGAAQLRGMLQKALTDGKQNIADYRAQLRAARKAGIPESEWPDSEADIASGSIPAARGGALNWKLIREEGDDYVAGGVNYGPGGAWSLGIDPAPEGADDLRESFYADRASTITKLDKAISNLIGSEST